MDERIEVDICYKNNYIETNVIRKKDLDVLKGELVNESCDNFTMNRVVFLKKDIASVTIESFAVQFFSAAE